MFFPILFSLVAVTVIGLAMSYMALRLLRIGVLLNTGVRDEPWTDVLPARIKMVLQVVFGQSKVLEDPGIGILHLFFMYGFLVLGIGHIEIVIEGLTYFTKIWGYEPFLYERLPGLGHDSWIIRFYHITQDVFAFLTLVAVSGALYRRLSGRIPRLQPRSMDAEIILFLEASLELSYFIFNGTFHLVHNDYVWHFDWSQPFTSLAAYPWTILASLPTVDFWYFFGWWVHVFVFCFFGCYIPHSKHMHLVFAGPNTFMFRKGPYAWRQPDAVAADKVKKPEARARARGLPPKIDFETAEEYGLSRITQLPVQTLLNGVACTECGRCNAVCPAHLTHKPLKPKKVVRDIKRNLLNHNASAVLAQRNLIGRPVEANKEAEAAAAAELFPFISRIDVDHSDPAQVRPLDGQYNDVDGSIHVDEAWACTTCGACVDVCPVLIDSVPGTLIGIRQTLVMMEGDMPTEVTNTMKNIERRGNPWGLGQDKRMDWAEGLDVPVFADIAAETPEREVEYLFWVGCAGSTDDNAKKVQAALVRILKASKVDFAVLGCEEKCTGDPARRLGNDMLFSSLAAENIETMKQYKFKKIFTTCPHCFNSLKNEYGEFGVDFSVQHHTELLQELLADKRIPLDTKKQLEEEVTFHDPCYLGRYNKQYDAPREILYSIGGGKESKKIKEMERNKEKSFCCGAGGGRMFLEEHIGDRVNVTRTEQAIATGATTVAVGCPFCKSMIIDGTKTKEVEEKIKVRDVAELLAERLLVTENLPAE